MGQSRLSMHIMYWAGTETRWWISHRTPSAERQIQTQRPRKSRMIMRRQAVLTPATGHRILGCVPWCHEQIQTLLGWFKGECIESSGENQILNYFYLDIFAVTEEVCVHVGRRPQIQFQLSRLNFHQAREHIWNVMNLSDWWLGLCELMKFDDSVKVWVSETLITFWETHTRSLLRESFNRFRSSCFQQDAVAVHDIRDLDLIRQ